MPRGARCSVGTRRPGPLGLGLLGITASSSGTLKPFAILPDKHGLVAVVNLAVMSPWRVALLSTLGMMTTAVAVYRLTPRQPLPTPPAATPPASDELVDEPSVADELPPVQRSVTAAPDAPRRVPTEQRAAPAPLPVPPAITNAPQPKSAVTSAPQRVPTEQRTAQASLPAAPVSTAPPAVAASSGAPAGSLAPGLGTLVAVAVGGSCEFSVDGHSIASSTTLRLPLPPGVHLVECGSRTRTVTIRDGEIEMAFFNLKK